MKSKINVIGLDEETSKMAEKFFILKGFSITKDITDLSDSLAMVVEQSLSKKIRRVDIPVIIVFKKIDEEDEWKSIWKEIGSRLRETTV